MPGKISPGMSVVKCHAEKEKLSVTIFLINGVKLQGIITWFDNFSILLKRDTHIQLVYKHSISTIMPSTTVSLGMDKTE